MFSISLPRYWPLIPMLFLLASCEEVIDVDLNTANPQIVVEASLSDEPGSYRVKLSRTVNFDETNSYPPVSNALVVISDDAGGVDTLQESTEAGVYRTQTALAGKYGRKYNLKIEVEGLLLTASSTLPQAVDLDSITTTTSTFGGEETIQIVPNFRDPAGLGNYYRFIQYNNDKRLKVIFVLDDQNSDGLNITRPLFNTSDDDVLLGDSVQVEMQSIDATIYRYFFSLSQISADSGPNASATPANPDSQFGKAALGYFSAYAVRRKGILIK